MQQSEKHQDAHRNMESEIIAVRTFWFGLKPEAWFRKDDRVDAEIRTRFGDLTRRALAGELDLWSTSAQGCLALILVLDQFPRNIFRGRPEAFSGDHAAQRLAIEAVKRGDDQKLELVERLFLVLPWEHAENLALQDRMVAYTHQLTELSSQAQHQQMAMFEDYAKKHRDVIKQFGRFPHRNAALGRRNTAAEEQYLAAPNAGF